MDGIGLNSETEGDAKKDVCRKMFVEGNLTFGFADLRLRLGRMIMNPSLFRTPSPALFFVLCVCVCTRA